MMIIIFGINIRRTPSKVGGFSSIGFPAKGNVLSTLRKIFGWMNQILVGSTIEYGYYTDNQIFGWANKIF